MIIESLTLHNVGTYAGRHHLELAPLDGSRPVTLIGGLNGAGKTTLMEAMQLALYGRMSPLVMASSETYERVLSDRISRSVSASDGASVELDLRVYEDGQERVITVRRAWSVQRSKFHEDVSVFVDGSPDTFLSENWAEASDRVFPARLASLFFFDGEKIEALANPESTKEAVRTAVDTLLGLDVVRQLESDLGTLTRMRLKNSAASPEARARAGVVEELEATAVRLRSELHGLQQRAAALRNMIDVARSRLNGVQRELERTGGLAYENRHQLEHSAAALRSEVAAVRAELRRLSEGDLPLALVRGNVSELLQQLRLADEERAYQAVQAALREQGEGLLRLLRARLGDGATAVEVVEQYLDTALADAPTGTQIAEPGLAAIRGSESRLEYLQQHLGPLVGEALEHTRRHKDRMRALEEAERGLSAIPDEATIRDSLGLRGTLMEELIGNERALEAVQSAADRTRSELDRVRARLERVVQDEAGDQERAEADQRIVDHARRATRTLERFRVKLVERQTDRLGESVLSRFRQLVRKNRLVSRVRIRTDDYGLDMYDSNGSIVPAARLSAGERQLLAVALLWALSNASGRALPVVVDTPLGRLDSVHRRNFVERYLPRVSHQTIVLSTDEEVDDELLRRFEPYVSQSYLLRFDPELGHSVVSPGFFSNAGVGASSRG